MFGKQDPMIQIFESCYIPVWHTRVKCRNALKYIINFDCPVNIEQNGHNIKFEFSGTRTPKSNGKVESKFQSFYGRIRETLNNVWLEDSVRTGVWADCARTTTFLSNITSMKAKDRCPYHIMFGSRPKLPKGLRNFGEMGVVTNKDDLQRMMKNCGLACMFVRYSVDHTNYVYRILNLNSKRIIQTRDGFWLAKGYDDWRRKKFLQKIMIKMKTLVIP
jgi:hypothetical protein